MKYKKIPARVVAAFHDYGEKVSYELPTLRDLIQASIEDGGPAIEDVHDLAEEFEGQLDIADDMLMSAVGWGVQSLADNAEDEGMTIAEYIIQEIETDGNCPYKETKNAFDSFTRDGDNWDSARKAANNVFVEMFGQSADDMLVTIAQGINEKLPALDGNKTENSAEEPTL